MNLVPSVNDLVGEGRKRGNIGRSQQFKKPPQFAQPGPLSATVQGSIQNAGQLKPGGLKSTTVRQSGGFIPGNIQTSPTSYSSGFTLGVHQLPMRPIIQRAKVAQKSQAPNFLAYGANTHNGLVRGYNEDRISIVLDLKKPGIPISQSNQTETDPGKKIQYFAVFDGHGGHGCAEFLRDNLHNIVASQSSFPADIDQALVTGCKEAEDTFMRQNLEYVKDRSGSCATVILVTKGTCYIANIGDSRAILSKNGGRVVESVTRDHKPGDSIERARVEAGGGRVYQSSNVLGGAMQGVTVLGPQRVLPGKLSVSRTFGDCTAKMEKYGGNPRCIVADPDIYKVKPDRETDFLMMGSDGIFDKMSSRETADAFWSEAKLQTTRDTDCTFEHVSDCCGKGTDRVLRKAMEVESMDNISVVVLSYPNFQETLSQMTSNHNKSKNSRKMSKPTSNQSENRTREAKLTEHSSSDADRSIKRDQVKRTASGLNREHALPASSRGTVTVMPGKDGTLPPMPPLSRERQQLQQSINSDSKYLVPVNYNYGGPEKIGQGSTRHSNTNGQQNNLMRDRSNEKLGAESKSVLPSLTGPTQQPDTGSYNNNNGMLMGRGRRIDKLSNISNDNNLLVGAGSQRTYLRKKFL